jgi:nucleotide-binding universal stress UspA family protein
MSFATRLKTIVVATDLHGRSGGAMEYARKIAAAYGARVVLAHGVDPVEFAAVKAVPGQVLEKLTSEARTELGRMAADFMREGIHSHSEIRQGAVADMLVQVVRQYQAGLILIGTEGKAGAGPVLVGSLAEQLVRAVGCPVLAVASDWNAGPHRPTPGGPVMLAMEQNEASTSAVEAAVSLAEVFERPLITVHARGAAGAGCDPCADAAKDLAIDAGPKVKVECVVKDGEPADAVAQAIEGYHPSILVVGVKRASETPGPHGTAFTLLARSRVPVLCVPPA